MKLGKSQLWCLLVLFILDTFGPSAENAVRTTTKKPRIQSSRKRTVLKTCLYGERNGKCLAKREVALTAPAQQKAKLRTVVRSCYNATLGGCRNETDTRYKVCFLDREACRNHIKRLESFYYYNVDEARCIRLVKRTRGMRVYKTALECETRNRKLYCYSQNDNECQNVRRSTIDDICYDKAEACESYKISLQKPVKYFYSKTANICARAKAGNVPNFKYYDNKERCIFDNSARYCYDATRKTCERHPRKSSLENCFISQYDCDLHKEDVEPKFMFNKMLEECVPTEGQQQPGSTTYSSLFECAKATFNKGPYKCYKISMDSHWCAEMNVYNPCNVKKNFFEKKEDCEALSVPVPLNKFPCYLLNENRNICKYIESRKQCDLRKNEFEKFQECYKAAMSTQYYAYFKSENECRPSDMNHGYAPVFRLRKQCAAYKFHIVRTAPVRKRQYHLGRNCQKIPKNIRVGPIDELYETVEECQEALKTNKDQVRYYFKDSFCHETMQLDRVDVYKTKNECLAVNKPESKELYVIRHRSICTQQMPKYGERSFLTAAECEAFLDKVGEPSDINIKPFDKSSHKIHINTRRQKKYYADATSGKCVLTEWFTNPPMFTTEAECLNKNYTNAQWCLDNQYICQNKQCKKRSQRCDFKVDCDDGSDERGCTNRVTCTDEEFTCDSGECIEKSLRCDKFPDCKDKSDEKNCSRG